MSSANWLNVYGLVCKAEGGYWNDPKGGPTLNGVTQSTYDSWRVNNGHSKQSVRLMTVEERTAIFRGEYWMPIKGDQLPPGLDYAVFDYAINSGPVQSIKDLQRVLNVAVDGNIGAKTIQAAKVAMANGGYKLTLQAYVDRRWSFMQKLTNFHENEHGWRNRLDTLLPLALTQAATIPFECAACLAIDGQAAIADDPAVGVAPGAAKALWRDTRPLSVTEGKGLAASFIGLFGSLIPQFNHPFKLTEPLYMLLHGYALAILVIGLSAVAWEFMKRRDEKRSY